MKLRNINAASLILTFDRVCQEIYKRLRDQYTVTRDYEIVIRLGSSVDDITIDDVIKQKDKLDGDSFFCRMEFVIDGIAYHICYGCDDLSIVLDFSFETKGSELYALFDDVFNFCGIKELRKTKFRYIADEQDLTQVLKRYEEFLLSYIPTVSTMIGNPENMVPFLKCIQQRCSRKNFIYKFKVGIAESLFDRGKYKRCAKAFEKLSTSAELTFLQNERHQQCLGALTDEKLAESMRQSYLIESHLCYDNMVTTTSNYKVLRGGLFLLLLFLFIGLFFLVTFLISQVYFGMLLRKQDMLDILRPDTMYCLLPAALGGFVAANITSYRMMSKIKKKTIRQFMTLTKAGRQHLSRFSLVILAIFTACLIQMVIFGLNWRVDFKKDGISDGMSFFSLGQNDYSYQDIAGLYFILHDPKNADHSQGFYVIKYKDGSCTNLNRFSNDQISKKAVPIFEKFGVPVYNAEYLSEVTGK